jgi:hypothetical protein
MTIFSDPLPPLEQLGIVAEYVVGAGSINGGSTKQ